MRISTESQTSMQNATATDPELSTPSQMIIDGWPEHIEDVTHNLWKYQSSVPILTVEKRLILCKEAMLILSSE